MSAWIAAPVLLPAMTAAFIVLAARFDLALQRALSIGSTAATLLIAVWLMAQAADGPPLAYRMGAWPPPFGIILVADRLSTLMLGLAAFVALVAVVQASHGLDRRGRHFHALFQFQLMGVNGAFLTGDLFNLFVFFEVLLIASYGLVLHGGGAIRLTAGIRYIVVNLTGSTLFLVAVALIYGVTGALNMADLALMVPRVAPGDAAILRAGAVLLLVVFGIKAAAAPLHLWLAPTYAAAPAPVAALFAILTKVGAYAILRMTTLVLGNETGSLGAMAQPLILWAAMLSLVLGAVGVVAARELAQVAAFAVLASMGTLLLALGLPGAAGTAAGLYYTLHSTLTAALLFLLVDVARHARGDGSAPLGPLAATDLPRGPAPVTAALFLVAALASVGLPPLSGFIGKLLLLVAAAPTAWRWMVWATVLGTSLLLTLGFARAGVALFWQPAAAPGARQGASARHAGEVGMAALAGPTVMAASLVLLTLAAGPITAAMQATATQLAGRDAYIAAVLGEAGLRLRGAPTIVPAGTNGTDSRP